jgi:inward rectifier potassium channel
VIRIANSGAMHRIRQQQITLGAFTATKIGTPAAIRDLYYTAMEISWPAFVAAVAVAFVLINLLFGTVYALMPGAIAGMTPGSVIDGFFFSVDTLGTVGYGGMLPATRIGHSVAAVEILTGLFFSATMTGLIFARFARPRQSLEFSKVAVIGLHNGQRALMVRLASLRSRPLADATAQILWLMRDDAGDRIARRLIQLPLVRDQNPVLGLSWTLVHILDPELPLLADLESEEQFQVSVVVRAVDTLLSTPVFGSQAYARKDVLIDHEYVDAVIAAENEGVLLDLAKLHLTQPLVVTPA